MSSNAQHKADDQLTADMELALAGELDGEQEAQLARRIAADPQLRRRWQQAVAMDVQMRAMLRPPDAQRIAAGARQVVSVASSTRRGRIVHAAQRRRRQARSRNFLWWGVSAAAACLLGAMLLLRVGQDESPTPSDPQLALGIISGGDALSGDLRWGAEVQARDALHLQVGVSQLALDAGARVRLAGAEGDPLGTVTLLAGSGRWQVAPHSGQQVVVRSPHLHVLVIGTAFSIASDEAGQRSHLRLHNGRLQVSDATGHNPRQLSAGNEIFADKDGLHQQDPTASTIKPWWQRAQTSSGSHHGFTWQGEAGRLHLTLDAGSGADAARAWGGVRMPMAIPQGQVSIYLGAMSGDPGSEWNITVSEADGDVWLMAYGAIADQPQRLHLDLHAEPKRLLYQGGDGDYDPQRIRYLSIGMAKGNARLQILRLEPPPLHE